MHVFLIIEVFPEENVYQNHQTHFEDVYFTWGNQHKQQKKLREEHSSPAFSLMKKSPVAFHYNFTLNFIIRGLFISFE